jgi:CheY-like chemotaxis protein
MAGNKTILLVEMRGGGQSAVWEVLRELGISERVKRAMSPKEALAGLRASSGETPAVILLDGFQPDDNGLDLLRAIKASEEAGSIPVIALAETVADRAAVDECYRIGVAGYIPRGTDRDETVRALRTMDEYWALSELPVGA